jgi:hypothetical protein
MVDVSSPLRASSPRVTVVSCSPHPGMCTVLRQRRPSLTVPLPRTIERPTCWLTGWLPDWLTDCAHPCVHCPLQFLEGLLTEAYPALRWCIQADSPSPSLGVSSKPRQSLHPRSALVNQQSCAPLLFAHHTLVPRAPSVCCL